MRLLLLLLALGGLGAIGGARSGDAPAFLLTLSLAPWGRAMLGDARRFGVSFASETWFAYWGVAAAF